MPSVRRRTVTFIFFPLIVLKSSAKATDAKDRITKVRVFILVFAANDCARANSCRLIKCDTRQKEAEVVGFVYRYSSNVFRFLLSFVLDRKPCRIEMRERLFQLFQLCGWTVHFHPGEIAHREHFRQQRRRGRGARRLRRRYKLHGRECVAVTVTRRKDSFARSRFSRQTREPAVTPPVSQDALEIGCRRTQVKNAHVQFKRLTACHSPRTEAEVKLSRCLAAS